MEGLIDIQVADNLEIEVPDDARIRDWIIAVFTVLQRKPMAVTVRVVGEKEITALNLRYRNQEFSTNVLSFPFEPSLSESMELLGDIAVCATVVHREAVEQQQPVLAHWAHMIVHGVLHLYGYDHQHDDAAATMEALEISILGALGFPDPYQVEPISCLNNHAKK
jgi:probable rRNA maturation factor